MRWWNKMSDNIKKGIRNWLQVQKSGYSVTIQQDMDHELYAIRNRIWWRGDGSEIEQFYQSVNNSTDKAKFWASKCSAGMEMRKIHVGLPGLMVRVLVNIVTNDMNEFEFEDAQQQEKWKNIAKENRFPKLFEKALSETLAIGDGAFKIVIDTNISEYPILQWCQGERVEFVMQYDRLHEIIIKTPYEDMGQQYVLHEKYGYGYVESHLYRGDEEVPLDAIVATQKLRPVIRFDKSVCLAVPLMVYDNAKYAGRGGSIFDGKLDSFDALDEAWSQWMDALRAGRAHTYIPDSLIPRDPANGKAVKPNPFDNRYIAVGADMGENAQNKIDTEQPTIPHDSYLASYITALDLCLQGVISPSTLGIDVKKLDNAEAQREKEKATLYTRGDIIKAAKETLELLVETSINAYQILNKQTPQPVKVDIEWGEYANPSFEAQIDAISKARQGGIMSIEKAVDELYGDTMDEKCKEEEVARLKAEQGIAEVGTPSVNLAAGDFSVNGFGE